MDSDQLDGFQLYIQLKNKKQISTDKLFLLLENIEREGSISKAATDMKISYRYAWGLINDTEDFLGIKLLDKKVGGAEGGGATLTEEGMDMLEHYHAIRDSVDSQLTALIKNKVDDQGKDQNAEDGNYFRYLLMASTMEPIETGLMDALEKEYFLKTGTLVRHIAVGSGKALQIARSGGVDLVFVHSPMEEDDFMSQSFGVYRRKIMANRYYLVGPESDPAGLKYLKEEAGVEVFFRQIALTKSVFISRGDSSGTHEKELEIWNSAEIPPEKRNITIGGSIASNMDCLGRAYEESAYTLVDSTSYKLSAYSNELKVYAGNKDGLDPKLDNIFSAIAVRRRPEEAIKYTEAKKFINWMSGSEGRGIIGGFSEDEGKHPYFNLID
ncbi:substrate-binding domain-containing protein [Gudongella sp. SC589]|uniref:substrate-binding domain-containing protein n=1 Tax=Gudongella sp. SC589 TaxID=3385990 RepID=UPI003904943C